MDKTSVCTAWLKLNKLSARLEDGLVSLGHTNRRRQKTTDGTGLSTSKRKNLLLRIVPIFLTADFFFIIFSPVCSMSAAAK